MKYMNSKDVALLMGVNVSTIKRWTDANKLPCYQTPGGHRKFTLSHIKEFLKNNKSKIQKVNLIELNGLADKELIHYIEHAEFAKLIPIFFKAAIEANQEKINTIITGLYLKGLELDRMYDQLVFPVLRMIGELWAVDKLSIYQEHLASEVIRKSIYELGEVIDNEPPIDAPSAICFSISGDEHELPLIMTKQILELNGVRTFNMGRSLPVKSLVRLLEKVNPQYLIISANYHSSQELIIKEINELVRIIDDRNIELFVGGSDSSLFKAIFGEKVFIINNMNELVHKIN